MPVSVTVSRGNPLPAPIALLFTVVGAALMVIGYTVLPPVPEVGGGFSDVFLTVIAFLFIVPTWLFYIAFHIKNYHRRRHEVIDVPEELAEPPSRHDAEIVATVVGEGTPSRQAIAATTLELASRHVLSVQEYGDRIVVEVPAGANGETKAEDLVIAGLRRNAGSDGNVTGPPIWPHDIDWWRQFRNDARTQCNSAGFLVPRIPYIGLILVLVFTSVGISLIVFERIAVFVGLILFANGLPHLLARVSGYKLGPRGRVARANWLAFGRYLRQHSNLRELGPAAVAVWGPNLVYAVILGEAPRAAAPLTPGTTDESEDEAPPGPIAVEL